MVQNIRVDHISGNISVSYCGNLVWTLYNDKTQLLLVHEPEGWSVPYWGANSDQYFWIPHNLSFNLMGDSNAGVVA